MSAASHSLKIERIEIIPLDVVPVNKRRIPTGPHLYGGKGSWVGRPVMLRVCAGGLSGWGLVRPVNPFVGETAASMFACLRDFYAPLCIGRDALNIEDILRNCELQLPKNPAALAVLDFALHDLVGKALEVPVHVLLGGACKDKIEMEWSLGLADDKTMIDEALMAIEKYGVNYLCVKVGPMAQIDIDVRVVTAVRKALGPDVFLGVDANTTYDRVNAVKLVERLADVDLTYFEQPVAAEALGAMRWIRDHARVAVLADESVYSATDAANVIASQAADVLGLKFYKCGGLRRSREIAVIAAAAGLPVNCAGTANGSYIEAIAGAHLCASIPNHAFGAEFMMGLPAVAADSLVKNQPIDIKDGYCSLPQLPGLGIEIDEAEIKRHELAHEVVTAK
ncbi:MAG: hypothetical protein JWL63_2342 [Rhodocyclales bacterium]|nr:hypothetical protein [Rhodocyclales bacterium]